MFRRLLCSVLTHPAGPRMAEKLLLHIQYECARFKIDLPLDMIAHRLHPGSSGAALVQHMGRLRQELIAEGHLVPPVYQRSGASSAPVEPDVRGYIRKHMDGDDKVTTRPVKFSEKVEDRRFNLPDAFDMSMGEDTQSFSELDAEAGTMASSSTVARSSCEPGPTAPPTPTAHSYSQLS